jgi:hypothetical protein
VVEKCRLSAEFAQNISNWRHSGFHVYCGPPVEADHPEALECLAAYILRPSFASTRVRYLAGSGQVHYRTAKGVARSMDALDWIAQVVSHIPIRVYIQLLLWPSRLCFGIFRQYSPLHRR